MKIKLLSLTAVLLLTGCGKTAITDMYKGKYDTGVYKNPSPEPAEQTESRLTSPIINRVAVVPLEPQPKEKPEKPITLNQYHPSVSREIIKVYAKLAGNNSAEFLKLMKEPLSTVEKDEQSKTDYSKVTVRLNFTFVNNFLENDDLTNPNTRIEYLNTSVIPLSDNFVFYNLDKFQNEVKLVDVGTLSREQNVKFGVELSGTYGAGYEKTTSDSNGRTYTGTQNNLQNYYDGNNLLSGSQANGAIDSVTTGGTNTGKTNLGLNGSAKANYGNETNYKENANLKHDVPVTGYSFDTKHLTIMKRGVPLENIPNETFVTTTLQFKNVNGKNTAVSSTVTKAYQLLTSAGAANKPDQVAFKNRTVNYNKCNANKKISLKVVYDGMIRVAANKRKNNQGEFDDRVSYLKFENITIPDIELDLNDYCSKVYKIMIHDGKKDYTLYMKSSNTPLMELQFFQDDNYQEFITWLNKITSTKDYHDLKSSKYSFYFSCVDSTDNASVCPDIEVISDTMDDSKFKILKAFLQGKTITEDEIM